MDLEELSKLKCESRPKGTPALSPILARKLLAALPEWALSKDETSIRREWLMKDFAAGVELIGRIKDVAEADDHHPDVHLTGFRRLAVELSTHSIGGLSDNDFIVAAKIERLPKSLKV